MAAADTSSVSRHAVVRERIRRAKVVFGIVASATFVVGVGLARAHRPSHARTTRPLAAPTRFSEAVRRDLLARGVIAPPESPPSAETGLS